MSNMKKKKTSSPVRGVKKDVAWNRIAVFFVVLAVVVVAIMSLKDSTLSTEMNFYNYVRPVLIPLFAVLTAGAIALWVTRRKKGVDESKSSFPASMMTIFSGGLFVVSVLYPYLSATRLLVSLIAASALYFLYYLYPRAFFVYAAETLIGGLLLSFFRYGTGLVGLIVPLVLLVALEAVMVLCCLARQVLESYCLQRRRPAIPWP